MINYNDPVEIWKAYERGKEYKDSIDLFETVEQNERFYVGDQWHGLNAPNITKPVLNHIKRSTSIVVAKVCADDIAANIVPFVQNEETEKKVKIIRGEVNKIIELCDLKSMGKLCVRNAAVDGDGCVYTYWDAEAETGQDSKGMVAAEIIENTKVFFANPYTTAVQGQRYIIISRRLPVGDVRERAEANKVKQLEEIVSDTEMNQGAIQLDDGLCTLLTVLFKKDGSVHAVEATEKVIVREEWDTELKRYPVAWLPWEPQRESMHGRAMITDMIPNQIAINKAYAGLIRVIERMGFPIMILNGQFVPKNEKGERKWNGQPGSIMDVTGAPGDVRQYATYLEGAPINPSISGIIDNIATQTRETMGTNDASSGNVRPENTSAIIALQNTDTVPLELNRQTYNGFMEDIVRNIVDMIAANYGKRQTTMQVTDPTTKKVNEQVTEFDFDDLDYANLRISVDIGAASMWSEITQMDAINAIFTSGIMQDLNKFKLYLEVIPDKYLNAKAKLLAWVEEQMAAYQQPQQLTDPNQQQTNEPYGGMPMEYNNAPTIAQEGYPNV